MTDFLLSILIRAITVLLVIAITQAGIEMTLAMALTIVLRVTAQVFVRRATAPVWQTVIIRVAICFARIVRIITVNAAFVTARVKNTV